MTDSGRLPSVPAMTRAEQDLVDSYLRVVDLLGRINPGRADNDPTRKAVVAAQGLVSASRELLKAVVDMSDRGEETLFSSTLEQAILALDGERRVQRLLLSKNSDSP
jgi:hypothetical protein